MKRYSSQIILAVIGLVFLGTPAGAQEVNAESGLVTENTEEVASEPAAVVSVPELDEDEPETSTSKRLLTTEKPECPSKKEPEAKMLQPVGADRVFAGHRFLNLGSQRSALIMSSFNFIPNGATLTQPDLSEEVIIDSIIIFFELI